MAPLKLLVVEDDVPSLELMREVFTALKAEVFPLSDSAQAAVVVDQQKFDGIFLDLAMPRMHGLELAKKIRTSSWNKTTPIIIVTGSDDRQNMQQAFAMGVTFFLQKPVDRQKLTKLFRSVVGGLTENRRRTVRVPLQTDVVCEVGNRSFRGTTWNLSQGGMQVEAGNLQPADVVHVSFRLPVTSITIDAVGKVAWSKESRQGIQFTKVGEQSQKAIRDFVAAVEK